MRKRIFALLAMTTMVLTACGADATKEETSATAFVETEKSETEDEAQTEQKAVNTKTGAEDGELTVADIKGKYAPSQEEEVMPLYNVAEDQTFDFTFQADQSEFTATYSELVSIHTDKECLPESECYAYIDVVDNESGFTLSLSPISAVMETKGNEEDEELNDHAVWGNAPVYYIAIHYDMEAKEAVKLETPTIIPFTVKHEVPAPEVQGVVDANGCFKLTWEPVEGAEEYRIYNLVDGNQWTGEYNDPVDGASSGYMNSSLLYMTSVTGTEFADFDGSGTDSVNWFERSVSGKLYCIGQNYSVNGEYYVSAVVDGKESGFAGAVKTADLQIPYKPTEADDIMFADFETVDELPLTMDVLNIDGSVTPRNVYYTFQWEKTWLEDTKVPEYAYQIEGTMLTGCVTMRGDLNGDYPENVGTLSTIGRVEPDNDINKQPDADVEPIIEPESENIDAASLIEQQKENTEKHKEKGEQQSTKTVDEKYMFFADNAEEEWLTLNMINGETEISLEAFPGLQSPETLEDVFYKVYYQNPYILGVRRFGYDYRDMTFRVEYAYSSEEMEQMREEIYAEATHILDDIVTDDMGAEEKRQAIYQYLEANCEYDYDALEEAQENNFKKTDGDTHEDAFNTYGILVKKKGVCQSFAYSYKLLCAMSGVECNVMTGYLDGSLPHAWNVVKIEDEWYQTDSTNNANVAGIPYFLYNCDSETAKKTGFTGDLLFERDEEVSEYGSTNREYEYYFSNNLIADSLDEYTEILESLVGEQKDHICVRYDGDAPDTAEFENAVAEVYYRNNLEQKLGDVRYMISNNFIVINSEK